MSAHQLSPRCRWCLKLFETRQAVRAHEKAKHVRGMPMTEQAWQEMQLAKLDCERKGLPTRHLWAAE